MAPIEDVIKLYRAVTYNALDKLSPEAHLSTYADVKAHGEAMQELILLTHSDSILDIGCGTGNPLIFIDPILLMDIQYFGVDINRTFVKTCRERFKGYRNLTFSEYDIWSMNLKRTYDAIFVNETFAYFNAAEICTMIDYYAQFAARVFSASILMDKPDRPPHLLIEQTETAPIVNHVIRNYKHCIINRSAHPTQLRIDIAKIPFSTFAKQDQH